MVAGRKPRYKTVDEMQRAIDTYFEDCKGETVLDEDGAPMFDKYGRVVTIGEKPPTVTGLALALGFTSRQALLNYQGKAAFVDTVTRAKAQVEEYAETRLYDRDGQRGAEFSLKCNFKWNDKPEQIVDTDKPVINIDIKTKEGADG